MRHFRIPPLIRVAFATLFVLLAGCDDGLTMPSALTGNWLAVVEQGTDEAATRVEDRLELTDDGRYVWTTVAFGAEGRSQDGMLAWFTRSGDWGVEGDRLALRTMGGMAWENDGGSSQVDFIADWNRGHQLRMEGGRLVIVEMPPPERSAAARTYVFQRTASSFGGPRP